MSSRLPTDENDVMAEATFCPQCKQKYGALNSQQEAKLLNCLDTFCVECLQRHIRDMTTNYPWAAISCQLCQTPINENSGGIEALKVNPIVEILLRIEAIATDPKAGHRSLCDACDGVSLEERSTDTAVPYAEFYCEECDQKLCSVCHSSHGKLRVTKTHKKVVRIGSEESKNLVRSWKERLPNCSHHKNQAVGEFYCSNCKLFVCNGCGQKHAQEHGGSPCRQSGQIIQELRAKITQQATDVAKLGKESFGKQQTITEQRKLFTDNIKATTKEIQNRVSELREILQLHEKDLLEQLQKIRVETEEAFEEATDAAKLRELRMNRFVKFADMTKTVDLATLNALFPLVIQRANDLKQAPVSDSARLISVSLSPGLWQQTVTTGKNCIGSIVVDTKRSPPLTQNL